MTPREAIDAYVRRNFGIDRFDVRMLQSEDALRVELQGSADERLRTAESHFARFFAPNDPVLIYGVGWPNEATGQPDDDVFVRLISQWPHEFGSGNDFYGVAEPDEEAPYIDVAVSVDHRPDVYRELLASVIRLERGETPASAWRIFFANESRPVLFHLYDDRGLTVVARPPE